MVFPYMETRLLLTLTILCTLHWLIIMTRDVTCDRTGPAMLIEGTAVLRDVAKLLAAFSTSRIEVGQQDVSQHGQNDDNCHYQCHAVCGRLQEHSSNTGSILDRFRQPNRRSSFS